MGPKTASAKSLKKSWLRLGFFGLIARPFMYVGVGLNVQGYEHLPKQGPAIIVANHNSHLDTLALLSLFPLGRLRLVRPIAAMDYFMKNKALAWFACHIIGIIPINRKTSGKTDPLEPCDQALANNEILILFPEGTRGEPESLSEFKRGIAHLAQRHPDVPITPVFLKGLGKTLPKGACIPIPFFCDIAIGQPRTYDTDKNTFMKKMAERFRTLGQTLNAMDK